MSLLKRQIQSLITTVSLLPKNMQAEETLNAFNEVFQGQSIEVLEETKRCLAEELPGHMEHPTVVALLLYFDGAIALREIMK